MVLAIFIILFGGAVIFFIIYDAIRFEQQLKADRERFEAELGELQEEHKKMMKPGTEDDRGFVDAINDKYDGHDMLIVNSEYAQKIKQGSSIPAGTPLSETRIGGMNIYVTEIVDKPVLLPVGTFPIAEDYD